MLYWAFTSYYCTSVPRRLSASEDSPFSNSMHCADITYTAYEPEASYLSTSHFYPAPPSEHEWWWQWFHWSIEEKRTLFWSRHGRCRLFYLCIFGSYIITTRYNQTLGSLVFQGFRFLRSLNCRGGYTSHRSISTPYWAETQVWGLTLERQVGGETYKFNRRILTVASTMFIGQKKMFTKLAPAPNHLIKVMNLNIMSMVARWVDSHDIRLVFKAYNWQRRHVNSVEDSILTRSRVGVVSYWNPCVYRTPDSNRWHGHELSARQAHWVTYKLK